MQFFKNPSLLICVRSLILTAGLTSLLPAQSGIITTVLGSFPFAGAQAREAGINSPGGMAFDRDGNLYCIVTGQIIRISRDGVLSVFAGTPAWGNGGDGGPPPKPYLPPSLWQLWPSIRRASCSLRIGTTFERSTGLGIITAFAGDGQPRFQGDGGPASQASLNGPKGIAFARDGSLYVADRNNHRVRKIDPSGIITTVAGTGQGGFSGDGGEARNAALYLPTGLAVSPDGSIAVADYQNQRIRLIGTDGIIRVVAGNGTAGTAAEGVNALQAPLNNPTTVLYDEQGRIVFMDSSNNRIARIERDGQLVTVAGNRKRGEGEPGQPAVSTALAPVAGIAFSPTRELLFSDTNNHRILRLDSGNIVNLFAGAARMSGAGGPALFSRLISPGGIAFDREGNLCVADNGNSIVRCRIAGKLKTIGGTTVPGDFVAGSPFSQSPLRFIGQMEFGPAGDLYFLADGNQLWKVTREGMLERVAGRPITAPLSDGGGFSGDGGPALNAEFAFPRSFALAKDGTIYIADTNNHRIRRIAVDGTVTTLAGNGNAAYSGDNGPAALSSLNLPFGVAVDNEGNVIVADTGNRRVRKITPGGTITTIAGAGRLWDQRGWRPCRQYRVRMDGSDPARPSRQHLSDRQCPHPANQ